MYSITAHANEDDRVLAHKKVERAHLERELTRMGERSFGRPFYLVAQPVPPPAVPLGACSRAAKKLKEDEAEESFARRREFG